MVLTFLKTMKIEMWLCDTVFSLENLKYLLSGPLWETFADPKSKAQLLKYYQNI